LYRDRLRPPSHFLADGAVADVVALARDLAHLRDGRGMETLAAAWARREAADRFGAERVPDATPVRLPIAVGPAGAAGAPR
ncbi:MAG: hypothetical protein P1P87_13815, partial [Trueperaceae bacterium]|nr:hypothetical protein [Trueperaceae bacterium]